METAEIIKDYSDIQKIIKISKGSTFKLDDRIFVSPRGLHMGTIIIEGRVLVIPPEFYVLK